MSTTQSLLWYVSCNLCLTGIFLRFNNAIFPNSSSVLVSDLQPIQCHSDNSEANGQPEWRFLNGTRVREDGVIVATKQETHVTLSRADNTASVPLGQYCCLAQDARRRSHTLCVNIIPGKLIALLIDCDSTTHLRLQDQVQRVAITP